ncbi:hypothetical protein ABZP36_007466 [Zizania latifolia]
MWCGVLSLFRQGSILRGRRRRRRTARVVDESALGVAHAGAADGDDARGDGHGAAAGGPGALARALLAMACAIRLDGEHPGGGGADEAWATSGWRPPRADEVSHLVVRESMRYAIYA